MQHLDSHELIIRTKNLVEQERATTLALIEHLQEIDRRMLYAKLGFGSLWEFATQELGLSEGAAQRRIQAMRLLRDVPHAKPALQSGKLSLSNAAKVQNFRQAEKRQGRIVNPQLLIAKVESLSQRECERVLLEISPQSLMQDRERLVSASGDRELKFTIDAKLHDKLFRLRSLLSHAIPEATYAQLMEYLVDQTLPRLEKKKGLVAKTTKSVGLAVTSAASTTPFVETGFAATSTQSVSTDFVACTGAPAPVLVTVTSCALAASTTAPAAPQQNPLTQMFTAAAAVEAKNPLPAGLRVYLPTALKKAVWARGGGQCEIVTHGRRCQSRTRIEIDHITPLAHGGANTLKNLRLACWHHNQQRAREKLTRERHKNCER